MRLAVLSASWAAAFTLALWPASLAHLADTVPPADAAVDSPDIGPHHRVWRRSELVPDGLGGWRAENRSFIELATGLNRWDAQTKSCVPARAEFEVTTSGHWVARHTAHQLILPPDLCGGEPVDLLAPDGLRLQWSVLGLALIDRATGRNVLLAEPHSCRGEGTGGNEVMFEDAFDDVAADIRYRLTLDGLEQDVILREQIGPELVVALGLNPLTTRLLVLSEFLDAPEATVERRMLGDGQEPEGTTITDDEVSFGAMRLSTGKAFGLDDAAGFSLPVEKSWERLDGRQVLVEAVEYARLGPLMDALPLPDQGRIDTLKAKVRRTAKVVRPEGRGLYAGLDLPRRRGQSSHARVETPAFRDGRLVVGDEALVLRGVSGVEAARGEVEPASGRSGALPSAVDSPDSESSALARAPLRQARLTGTTPGLVLDFVTLASSATNFTFRGDTTYYVSGTVNLSGVTTLEGGTVIKYNNSGPAKVVCSGSVVCNTGPFRPAVFTAKDDQTVGEAVTTNSTPSGYYANPALEVRTGGQNLHHLRFAYATMGLFFYDFSAGSNLLSHAQWLHCDKALGVNGYGTYFQRLGLRNALMHNVQTGLYGYSFTSRVEHLTLHQCNRLAYDYNGTNYGTTCTVSVANSLLVAVTNGWGNVTVSTNSTASLGSSNGVFQTVGAGGFYLADGAQRNAGTTNIDATLAAELEGKTTYPPMVWSNVLLTTDTTLSPQAGRDSDLPDLGYHYDPIDHAVSLLMVTNALATNGIPPAPVTLTLLPGTVVGQFGSRGLQMEFNSRLVAEGKPTQPIRLVRYHAVQEQSLVWGDACVEPYLVLGPPRNSVDSVTNAPSVSLRFVEGTLLGGMGYQLVSGGGWWLWKNIGVQDCQFTGGRFQVAGHGGTAVELKNNLFAWVWHWESTWPVYNAYNNLFYGGTTKFERYAGAGTWTVRDNAFHGTTLTLTNQAVVNDHNAYLGSGQPQLPGSGGGDVVLSSFVYTNVGSVPQWRFYQVSTNLVNVGSRNATDAGLYHFTTQATQAKETNSIVDIGFHYVATVDGSPIDSDFDGVLDYVEDSDGDGAQGPNETNYLAPVSGGDGRLDGEVRASEPRLDVVGYQGSATLDYTTSERGMETPDRQFTMTWSSQAPSTAVEIENRMECYHPPIPDGTVYRIVKSFAWPAVGDGRLSSYGEKTGGGPPDTYPDSPSVRPPSCYSFMIPCEKCFTFTAATPPPDGQAQFNGTFTRSNCSTTQKLHPGGTEWPKPFRSIVLNCTAIDKRGGDSTRDSVGRIAMKEPDDRWVGVPLQPATTTITISGQRVNADGTLMLQLPVGYRSRRDVAPMIDGITWYMWELTLGEPHIVRMTWSKHPFCPSVDMQGLFDEAGRNLAKDDDALVKDDDTRLNDPTFRNEDDVPTYLEFLVIKAQRAAFPSSYVIGGFTNDFTLPAYNDITDPLKLDILREAQFANVKLVNTIELSGIPYAGKAGPGVPGIVLAKQFRDGQPPQWVSLDWLTAVHEYGHTAGIEHRGLVVPPPTGYQPNPGNFDDATAIMHHRHSGGQEVNRFERNMYKSWDPPLWNE